MAVATLLLEAGYTSPELLAAALLHDVQEDCGVTPTELSERFGAEVARMVSLLTKSGEESLYFERVFADRYASLIKAADRLHNIAR